jgi:hypothetical protein
MVKGGGGEGASDGASCEHMWKDLWASRRKYSMYSTKLVYSQSLELERKNL